MAPTKRRNPIKKSITSSQELFEESDDMEYAFAVFKCYYPTKTEDDIRAIVRNCNKEVFGTSLTPKYRFKSQKVAENGEQKAY